MVRREIDNFFTGVRKEAREISSTLKDAASSVRDTFKDGSFKSVPKRINEPRGIDPVKIRKFIVTIIKLLIIFEFISAIIEGTGTDGWGRLGRDLVLAGVVCISEAAWIHVKASLAQALIGAAWRREQVGSRSAQPWPWSDTRPVARLIIGEGAHARTFIVLEGSSGRPRGRRGIGRGRST